MKRTDTVLEERRNPNAEQAAPAIIEAFRARYDATVELAITAEETENFLVNRELRGVPLTREDMAFVNG